MVDRWSPTQARLHQTLRSRQLLSPNQSILMAVSGGQDSLCLARLLLDLQSRWGWRLAIAHCNHRWRSDAEANAEQVRTLAQAWGVPFFLQTARLAPKAEAAARDWRYAALSEIALAEGFEAIATGHTASDRAETLLYNLVRGSGSDGLSALSWRRSLGPDLWLVRPLLDFTRAETAAFCRDSPLPVWCDSSNQDTRYARNRLRLEVLPHLRAINPQAERHLAQTAELLQDDVAYLEAQAAQLRQKLEQQDCALQRQPLRSAPLALQRRVMRQFLQQHLPGPPNRQQIEKLMVLIEAPNGTQTDPFPGGAIAKVEGSWIRLIFAQAAP